MVKLGPNFIHDFKSVIQTNTRSRRIMISILLLTLWSAIVLPVIFKQYYGTLNKGIIIRSEEVEENNMLVELSIAKVDTALRIIDLKVNLFPNGPLYANDNSITKQNITCDFRYGKVEAIKDKVSQPTIIKIPILSGNPRAYPFENLTTIIPIYCQDQQGSSVLPIITFERTLATYYLTTEAFLASHVVEASTESMGLFPDPSSIQLLVELTQPTENQLFVFLVFFIMWGLSFAILFFTFDVLIHKREVPPPLIGVSLALLFALPGIRNSQPGVPFLGCLSDFISFFWCLSLVSFCTVANMLAFALRFNKKV